jgi:hypothetical protein
MDNYVDYLIICINKTNHPKEFILQTEQTINLSIFTEKSVLCAVSWGL